MSRKFKIWICDECQFNPQCVFCDFEEEAGVVMQCPHGIPGANWKPTDEYIVKRKEN